MIHVMLDLETLGTTPGSIIVAVGACVFDSNEIGTPMIRARIDAEDAEAHGLTISASTVKWWLRQSSAAISSTFVDKAHLCSGDTFVAALDVFAKFLVEMRGRSADGEIRLWSHGASFDPVLLEAAYRLAGLDVPWHFAEVRDTRTLFELAGVAPKRFEGVHHDALDDAMNQARAVQLAWRALREEHASVSIPDDATREKRGDVVDRRTATSDRRDPAKVVPGLERRLRAGDRRTKPRRLSAVGGRS